VYKKKKYIFCVQERGERWWLLKAKIKKMLFLFIIIEKEEKVDSLDNMNVNIMWNKSLMISDDSIKIKSVNFGN
jgi:hypothetical protein